MSFSKLELPDRKTTTRIVACILAFLLIYGFIMEFKIPGTPRTARVKVRLAHETVLGYIVIMEIQYPNQDMFYERKLKQVRLYGNFTVEEDCFYEVVYKTTFRPYHWNLKRVKRSSKGW